MSVRTMATVWASDRPSGTELLLLLAIADFADDQGRAYPSVSTLAAKCRMTARNANHILAKLRDSGLLEIRTAAGPRGANAYRIRLEALTPLKFASPQTPEAQFTPEAGFTLKPTSSPPEAGFSKPLKPDSPKPPLNHQESSTLETATTGSAPKRKGRGLTKEHPLFAEFYAAYPRKLDRHEAAKAFEKANPDRTLLDEMLAAIKRQGLTARCAAGDAQFVPYPSTWLNRQRWRDETPATGATSDIFAGAL